MPSALNAAENALADDYKSITDGLELVGTIVFWSFLLNWLGHRYPRFQRFLRPQPLPLVKDGQLLRRNICRASRRELDGRAILLARLDRAAGDFSAHAVAFDDEPTAVEIRQWIEGDLFPLLYKDFVT